jgi:DNA (cytosine-5)-methyltransferase 1
MASFYEFFAGGGMVRAGLGSGWTCQFANDIDPKKGAAYAANWGVESLRVGDVAKVQVSELPSARTDLAWASFPCQDLSLAGAGAGLDGERSGTFWPFWDLMRKLSKAERGPRTIVLENVCGALTSHGGRDFAAISSALVGSNYRFGALVVDAIKFLPQSRPRLFFIAVAGDQSIPPALRATSPLSPWHPQALLQAQSTLSEYAKSKWVWWTLPQPTASTMSLADLIEEQPESVQWHTPAETTRLLSMMSETNRAKVETARKSGERIVGAVYRRTRLDAAGCKVQRAEVRFDVAGCLRTPSGGSSRQSILVVEGRKTRSRLLSSRETARLMGLPDSYVLPVKYNDAYHLTGDGVAVPVVRHIASTLLEPLLGPEATPRRAQAA